MQLDDGAIRQSLHADIVSAWNVVGLRPDVQRTMNAADQLPKARVELQPGISEPIGGAAASREAVLPHTYHITGTFQYPSSGTVNEAQVEKWNQMTALLTAQYPYYNEWRYREEIGWDWDDDPDEQTYTVTVIFTLDVISRVRMIGP